MSYELFKTYNRDFIIDGKTKAELNRELCYACYEGHMDLVLLLLANDANAWNTGLVNAVGKAYGHCIIND